MFADDLEQIRITSDWVEKAEHDLGVAALVLKTKPVVYVENVCFHALQCIKKYLKAALIWHKIEFPKTHDLERLVRRLPPTLHLNLTGPEQDTLTRYATITRYPGNDAPITLTEARRVRREVRRWLPKATLKP